MSRVVVDPTSPSGQIHIAFWYRVGVVLAFVPVALMSGTIRAAEADGATFFRQKIEPVLKEQCYSCHSSHAEKLQGGLKLDSRSAILHGGDSGPAVIVNKSDASLLLQAIRHEGGLAMPPKKEKLSDQAIADFVKWIELGLPAPLETATVDDDSTTRQQQGRQHWAFQPLKKTTPPIVRDQAWGTAPIDAFILAKLEERNWRPAPAADKRSLIRRVYFDLIGLPPAPEEIDAFVNDADPDVYPRLVNRLLDSRHYGERWAQHWLDVVRYAESEGYEYDRHVPDAWRYRDYVIESFNADKPFDRFVTEQIAGDEIGAENHEYLTASIFFRIGAVRRNAGNPEIALSRNEVLTERTDIVGASFLGLTVGCARCHNHKLEPISQKDYYRLQAYMAGTEEHNVVLATPAEQKDHEAVTNRMKTEITALRESASKLEGGQKVRLEEQIARLEEQLPQPFGVIPAIWNDTEKRTKIHVLRRGIWEHKGEPVGPRPPEVLVNESLPELPADISNPRTQLAAWLSSPQNPLTARVYVNRLWQHHFGIGLVKSANDFGVKGDRPSHPELLDWLAASFVENGWHSKPVHRLIVLSNAYQQASVGNADQQSADPENRLLWHFSRRRLSAEEVRDAMLAISGRINLKPHGPSVIVPVEQELVQLLYNPGQWAVTKDPTEHDRRTIYLIAKRNLRLPFLENFDAPGLQTSCARRESSTNAPQALEMLNGQLSNEMALAFADRLTTELGQDQNRLVERAFQLTLGRPPSPLERLRTVDFLRDQPVSELALALFNLNEFLYVR